MRRTGTMCACTAEVSPSIRRKRIWAASGLAVSSLIKSAESASPITNASYLPIAMISGIFDPTIGIPHWLSGAAGALPIKALAQVLEDGYTPAAHTFPAADLSILLAWAVAGGALTSWRFRRQTA
jgi:ABC-type multidrug transport system permease subunit